MKWRVVPGWPKYEVSECGDIRRTCDGVLRKPYQTTTTPSYLYLVLRSGPRLKRAIAVHRIVALAFIGPPPFPKAECCHRDGDSLHNHWRNLKWATPSENQMDRVAHGTSNRGTRQHMAKLQAHDVRQIRALLAQDEFTRAEIGRRFGVARQTVNAIAAHRSWYWLR